MMDPARAAPVLNLDAKPTAKPAVGGEKADAGDKKAMFRETLNRQLPSKNLQAGGRDEAEGDALLEIAIAVSDETIPDGVQQGGNKASATALINRPIVLLGQALRLEKAGEDAAPDTEKVSRIDIRTLGMHKIKAKDDAADQESSKTDAEDMGDLDLNMIAIVPQNIENGQQIHSSEDKDVKKAVKDSDVETIVEEEPARDVLSLLQETPLKGMERATPVQSASVPLDTTADQGQGEAGQDQGGPVYRLSRADGKGGALDIPASDQQMPSDAKPQETTINMVSVVDQRRFLAPAQDNALAVVNTIGGNPEWVSAMQPESSLANAAAVAGNGKVVNTLKIQMHPIDLGLITATMRLAGEELSVELKVENGAAYRQLKEDQSRIVEALKAQGFSVDQVSVVLAPEKPDTGNSQSNTTQNGPGGGFAQQNQARGGAQGQAAGRDNGGNQQETGLNGNSQADEGRSDVGAVGSRGVAGSGNLYL